MRIWYAVGLAVLLGLYVIYLFASEPRDANDWLLFGLPFGFVVSTMLATRACAFASSHRIRAGAEALLVVWTPIGLVFGFLGGALPRLVDGGPHLETLARDTAIWFGAGLLIALIPALIVSAVIALLIPQTWINHISPYKRPLGA